MAQLQTLRLGAPGSEQTLPTASRRFTSHGSEEFAVQGRSADGTLHTDFISRKRSWVISYNVVSQDTKDLLESIYDTQISTGNFLSFILTQDDGTTTEVYTVKMEPLSFGVLVPKDPFYYNGVTVALSEV